ncbi:MAG: efflux RND transporter permease subunit [Clostridium sp.]|nr:efflux RND transporter permease subunit [Clostridium sp.]
MKASSFSIIVAFIALAIVGCALVPLLPVKLAPSQALPALSISYSMPQSSARAVEQEVTSRIESVVARVAGVKDIESKSYNGGGRVSVSLDRHADIDNVRFEISALIRQLWSEMPDGAAYPSISMRRADDSGSRPFMALMLNAPSNPSAIQAYGEENLKPRLAAIRGVAKVEFSGAQPMEWRLRYDVDRLSALSLSPDDIARAIQEHCSSEFLGIAPIDSVSGQWERLAMKSSTDVGSFSPSSISVPTKSGFIPLDKIVEVERVEAEPTGYFRINGLNSIFVSLTAEEGANQLKLAKSVKAALLDFEKNMPQGYTVVTAYDATEQIKEELDKIYFRSGLTAIILLLFVWLATLSFRYMLMIAIGLALNLAAAAVFYFLSGIEIQLYSLAGITISLNLIIDNMIVMADHYSRRHNLRAFPSIFAATLTTIGALSIVFFLDERMRLSLQDFVIVVIINLSVSLAVALFLVPALVERLGIRRGGSKEAGKALRRRRRFSVSLSRGYEKVVAFIVRFRKSVIVSAILAFGIPVYFMSDKFKGANWNAAVGEPMLSINASLPNGATLDQMNALMRKMESYLSGFSEIRQFQTSISGPRRANILVLFKKEHQQGGFPYKLKSDVIAKAQTLGGGAWGVFGLKDMGFNNDVRESAGDYRIRLSGYNYDDLYDYAFRARDILLSHRRIKEVNISSEFAYYKDDYTEFHLEIDRDKLAQSGLTATELFSAIAPTFGHGIAVGAVPSDEGMERIRLYSRQGEDYDIFALMNQPFRAGGRLFKLSGLGGIEKRQSPQDIVKKNQEYILSLQFEYIGSEKQGEKVLNKDLEKINAMLPVGYKAEKDDWRWRPRDGMSKYWLVLLVVCIIFFIASILFNSLLQPLAIIFIIPVSFTGVFLAYHIFSLNIDQGGFASFILLAGITVNAAIYILGEYNSLRRQFPHAAPLKLYSKAFRIKIVPILLTVLSTALGFIPFLIGESKESFWYPLAIGVIGGLVMSMLAILIILPAFILPRRSGGLY